MKTTVTIQQIEKAARAAGISLYQPAYMSTDKALAQRQLAGRTHYCDDNTLRFFGARINSTRQDDNGLWFALRESVQPPHSGRVHRWAIFDIFGRCERTEERASGAAAAIKDRMRIAATQIENLMLLLYNFFSLYRDRE